MLHATVCSSVLFLNFAEALARDERQLNINPCGGALP